MQESVVKSILILIGQKTEELLEKKADKVTKNVNSLVGKLPLAENQETLPLKFEKMLEICVDSSPCMISKHNRYFVCCKLGFVCRSSQATFIRSYGNKSAGFAVIFIPIAKNQRGRIFANF